MKKETAAILRKPFEGTQISTFPRNAGSKAGLSYIGHAALTDRLLQADPDWKWEPVADPVSIGLPMAGSGVEMWILLTIDGTTRYGYGDAPGKKGGDAIKEAIGDALRNAAMRFGVALDLWHKGGDLYQADPDSELELVTKEQSDALVKVLTDAGIDTEKYMAYLSSKLKIKGYESIPVQAYNDIMSEARENAAKRTSAKSAKSAKAGA